MIVCHFRRGEGALALRQGQLVAHPGEEMRLVLVDESIDIGRGLDRRIGLAADQGRGDILIGCSGSTRTLASGTPYFSSTRLRSWSKGEPRWVMDRVAAEILEAPAS